MPTAPGVIDGTPAPQIGELISVVIGAIAPNARITNFVRGKIQGVIKQPSLLPVNPLQQLSLLLTPNQSQQE